MWLRDRLRQFWQALTQDDNPAAAEASANVRLMRTAQHLDKLLQKYQLQPGIDYRLSLQSRKFGMSLDSPRATRLARSQPDVRLALDRLFADLGELDGQAGYPCRLPQSSPYVASWKRASLSR